MNRFVKSYLFTLVVCSYLFYNFTSKSTLKSRIVFDNVNIIIIIKVNFIIWDVHIVTVVYKRINTKYFLKMLNYYL